jgi:hypothetical protein
VIGVLDRPSKRRYSKYWRRWGTSFESLTATSGRSQVAELLAKGAKKVSDAPPIPTPVAAADESAAHTAQEQEPRP